MLRHLRTHRCAAIDCIIIYLIYVYHYAAAAPICMLAAASSVPEDGLRRHRPVTLPLVFSARHICHRPPTPTFSPWTAARTAAAGLVKYRRLASFRRGLAAMGMPASTSGHQPQNELNLVQELGDSRSLEFGLGKSGTAGDR